MRLGFNLNGCNKVKQKDFNNILDMTVNVSFEFCSTNRSSADTNLTCSGFIKNLYESSWLATWQFKESVKGNSVKAVGKMRKEKRNIERKRKGFE